MYTVAPFRNQGLGLLAKPIKKIQTITRKFCARKHLRKKSSVLHGGKPVAYSNETITSSNMYNSNESLNSTESINCVEIVNAVEDTKSALFAEMMLDGKSFPNRLSSYCQCLAKEICI